MTTTPDPTIADRFADFAAGLRLEDVPAAIVAQAKLHFLDTLGCAIAGSNSDFASRMLRTLDALDGGGESVAIGQARPLSLRDAVLFNAAIGHMLDFDDTHTTTLNHVSVGAVPLVLALGARQGATGRDILTAYLIAAEVNCRVGLGASGPAFLHRGVHPTGALNVFGSALAAAWLTGLDAARMAHAQGIALSFAAGSMEWQRDGADAKRLHPGNAAVGGLTAAASAGAGITGPRLPYEGNAGIYRLFLGPDAGIDLDAVTNGLGARWAFAGVGIKPYPLVHHLHGAIEAALALAREDGVTPETIERLTVRLAAPQIPILCEPEETKRNPANAYQGIFSAYHTVATAIARKSMTLAETGDAPLNDPVVAALRNCIDCEPDPDSLYPRYYSGGVRASLKDGRTVERYTRHHPGSDRNPLPSEAIAAKFRVNAARCYGSDRVESIRAGVDALDTEGARNTLSALLGAP